MTASEQAPRKIAIIGGGITGLAAAWELRSIAPAADVTLYDAAPRLGGLIETQVVAGHTVELGPDSILRRVPAGVELCHEVGIKDELIGFNPAARGVYSVHHGRLVRVPDGLSSMAPTSRWQLATTPILSPAGKLRMLREARIPPRDASQVDESLADFARRRFGAEVFERLVQPLSGGIYMGDPERLSLPACFPQFAEMEATHGSLIRAARAKQSNAGHDEADQGLFATPQRGLRRLIDALRDQLGDVIFRLETKVESISQAADSRWQLAGAGFGDAVYDGAIIATPVRHAAALTEAVDRELGQLLSGIASSSCVIVIAAARRADIDHKLDATGFVVPHVESRSCAAASFSSQKYTNRVPDSEATFRVFMGGAQHPQMIEWPDAKLVDTALAELRDLVGLKGEPLWTRVVRWPESMPQYEIGHLDRVTEIERRMTSLPGLELAGNAYRGVGIPHCITSGRSAARRLLAAIS